jgi:hypothetical protein
LRKPSSMRTFTRIPNWTLRMHRLHVTNKGSSISTKFQGSTAPSDHNRQQWLPATQRALDCVRQRQFQQDPLGQSARLQVLSALFPNTRSKGVTRIRLFRHVGPFDVQSMVLKLRSNGFGEAFDQLLGKKTEGTSNIHSITNSITLHNSVIYSTF